jgi:D-glycero-D-manno-heptose 1,7-bisphosphate phosphatase
MTAPAEPARPFALLDRDGTLIEDIGYLSDPDKIVFCQGAVEALWGLRDAGFGLILVTNQSGIARGRFSHADLGRVHERLQQRLREHGLSLDAIYFCPHGPDDSCSCRKPNPGMLLSASRDFGFAMRDAYVIGDSDTDIGAARACGAVGIQIRYRNKPINSAADYVSDDLWAAVNYAIRRHRAA